ncbi:ATPase [Spongiactinospora gelatinilytica]|uniref:ATPase n=1 Tax=Spongiactinospora gelatinilytica TaxID=2666298 RepID=A0A2W2HL77_9ACTN|nr:BadF/BadG/BcrA/BcrD ATPase family protein [Spongiactinospora gelatinilytica]PZG50498.1 ATPase [Spongiactinospora gelatinilytica]
MTGRAAVLAIDAGNSKTDVALVSARGDLLAWVRGGGFNPHERRLPEAIAMIAALVRQAAPGGGPVAEHVAAFLAHCDLPVEQEAMRAEIAAQGWAPDITVDNDTFAILRAGSGRPYGVAVVCGGGMNCVALSPGGGSARYPALGRRSGDWGGGEFLAEEVLWWAVRDEDGRGAPTMLREAVPAHFGLPDVVSVCVAFHLHDLPEERLHELVPLLFEVAGRGDAVAGALVDRLGDETAVMATAAMDRLDWDGRTIPIVLGGGVLTAANPRLLARIEKGLRGTGADVDVRLLADPPVIGSALYGLDRLGATRPDVERRLTEAITTSVPVTHAPSKTP